jgi:hypothetical protein
MEEPMDCMLRDGAARSASRTTKERRTSVVRPTVHDSSASRNRPDADLARWFYCDLLRGRQIWPADGVDGRAHWFHVGESVVAVRDVRAANRAPAWLVVDDPGALAERCWDAGLTVQVREAPAGGTMLVVVDPFGRELVLVARDPASATDPIPCEASA